MFFFSLIKFKRSKHATTSFDYTLNHLSQWEKYVLLKDQDLIYRYKDTNENKVKSFL